MIKLSFCYETEKSDCVKINYSQTRDAFLKYLLGEIFFFEFSAIIPDSATK